MTSSNQVGGLSRYSVKAENVAGHFFPRSGKELGSVLRTDANFGYEAVRANPLGYIEHKPKPEEDTIEIEFEGTPIKLPKGPFRLIFFYKREHVIKRRRIVELIVRHVEIIEIKADLSTGINSWTFMADVVNARELKG